MLDIAGSEEDLWSGILLANGFEILFLRSRLEKDGSVVSQDTRQNLLPGEYRTSQAPVHS